AILEVEAVAGVGAGAGLDDDVVVCSGARRGIEGRDGVERVGGGAGTGAGAGIRIVDVPDLRHDADVNDISVGQRPTGSGVALVVGRDRKIGLSGEPVGAVEGDVVGERCVDIRGGA